MKFNHGFWMCMFSLSCFLNIVSATQAWQKGDSCNFVISAMFAIVMGYLTLNVPRRLWEATE